MYTVRGLLDERGKGSVLANAKDWSEAREKAAALRKNGLRVEIWHQDGKRIDEPEDDAIA